jgi:hypothetical protein
MIFFMGISARRKRVDAVPHGGCGSLESRYCRWMKKALQNGCRSGCAGWVAGFEMVDQARTPATEADA